MPAFENGFQPEQVGGNLISAVLAGRESSPEGGRTYHWARNRCGRRSEGRAPLDVALRGYNNIRIVFVILIL